MSFQPKRPTESLQFTNLNGENKSIHDRKVITVEKRKFDQPEVQQTEADGSPIESVGVSQNGSQESENQKDSALKPAQIVVDNANKKITTREEFSQLEKARKQVAEANKKAVQAEKLAEAYKSKDINKIAAAMGMTVSEYSLFVNQQVLASPTLPKLTPEQEAKQAALDWKKNIERELQEERLLNKQNAQKLIQLDAISYINKNITPHIVRNQEKFEMLIQTDDIDAVGLQVYEYMNEHYKKTCGADGKGGEELDPVVLLEALEEQALEDWQANEQAEIEKTKEAEKKRLELKAKIKKLNISRPTNNQPNVPMNKSQDESQDEEEGVEDDGTEEKIDGIPEGFTLNDKGDVVRKLSRKTKANPYAGRIQTNQADLLASTIIQEEASGDNTLAQNAPSNFSSGAHSGVIPGSQRYVPVQGTTEVRKRGALKKGLGSSNGLLPNNSPSKVDNWLKTRK